MHKPDRPVTARSFALAMAVVLTALTALLLSRGRAIAATIPGAITSITSETTSAAQWSEVDLACTWAVPDGSQPGDTFSLQLPAQLAWFGPADFTLPDANGDVVATGHADASGLVTFTLTDFVRTHPAAVHGTCSFATQYVATITQSGPQVLEFPVDGQVLRTSINTTAPCTSDCASNVPTTAFKWMWWADAAQTTLQSVIGTPILTAETNTVTITDTPGPGLALDCAEVTPLVGPHLDAGGRITEPTDTAQHPAIITCTPAGLTASWTDLPAGEYVNLEVNAIVTDSTRTEYTNHANVTIDGVDAPVSSTVKSTAASGTGTGSTAPSPSPSPSTTSPTSPSPTSSGPTSASSTAPSGASTRTSGSGILAEQASGPATLARTGIGTELAIIVAGLLTLAGIALVILGTRRPHGSHAAPSQGRAGRPGAAAEVPVEAVID